MSDELLKPQAEETPVETPAAPQPVTEQEQMPTPPAPDASAEEKTRYQKRIDQLTAARRSAEERARIAEDALMRQQYQQTQYQSQPQQPQAAPGQQERMIGQYSKSQWEEWYANDPLAANEYLVDLKADQKAGQVISQLSNASQYTETINSVYKSHPELKEVMDGRKTPEEVPFWQVYDEVAREMPDAKQLAKGPYIVMKEAERRMKERDASAREKQIADQAAVNENTRQQRSDASYTMGAGSQRPPSTPVSLTPEEDRIARRMGLSPEEYAKNKKVK